MLELVESKLQRLRDEGLYVSAIYPEGREWAGGVLVAKPSDIGGNCVRDYRFLCHSVETNAPVMALYPDENLWKVETMECCPRGPEDICNSWSTLEDAVEDVYNFFFGDSERMRQMKGERFYFADFHRVRDGSNAVQILTDDLEAASAEIAELFHLSI